MGGSTMTSSQLVRVADHYVANWANRHTHHPDRLVKGLPADWRELQLSASRIVVGRDMLVIQALAVRRTPGAAPSGPARSLQCALLVDDQGAIIEEDIQMMDERPSIQAEGGDDPRCHHKHPAVVG